MSTNEIARIIFDSGFVKSDQAFKIADNIAAAYLAGASEVEGKFAEWCSDNGWYYESASMGCGKWYNLDYENFKYKATAELIEIWREDDNAGQIK